MVCGGRIYTNHPVFGLTENEVGVCLQVPEQFEHPK